MLKNNSLHPYVGRFAPSPSGPLHFGSLVCALASFLHAKQHNGKWLVRIEDIDTSRSYPAMNSVILDSLQAHGLYWDDEVVYQSQRHAIYEKALSTLKGKNLLYGCTCSRQQIKARAKSYDRYCRTRNLPFLDNAIRFVHNTDNRNFTDDFLGSVSVNDAVATEDCVLKRADGIYAYHLAVVADDIDQQVTHIVRGSDLIDTTPIHLSLYQAFEHAQPHYLHIPVIVQKNKEKLSKQHHSPMINNTEHIGNLSLALQYLGIAPNLLPNERTVEALIKWAIEHWSYKMLSTQSELLILTTNDVYSAPADFFKNND